MKMRLVIALIGLAISFALPTFAQQKDTVDPKINQQIRVLAVKYDEAINNHDAAAVAAFTRRTGLLWRHNWVKFTVGSLSKNHMEKYDFQRWHVNNFFTVVDRVIAVRNEIRLFGTWSCVFVNHSGGT